MRSIRWVVFGYSDVGHACLKHLVERGESVAAVYTHTDAADETLWFPSVAALAREHGLEVRTPPDPGALEERSHLQALAPDLLLSCYYRQLLPQAILEVPQLGAYNVHGSLLPRYRGRAPVNWAVLRGESETGVTLHVMERRADAGDIVDQERIAIGPDDTAAEVQSRLTRAAVEVLARQIENLKSGRAPRRPQDPERATSFGRRTPEDGRIDWSLPARDIHNLVRAVSHPYPGAFTDAFGTRTFIWATRLPPTEAPTEVAPGRMRSDGEHLLVQCGDGREIEIVRAQRAGESETRGSELVAALLGASTDTAHSTRGST